MITLMHYLGLYANSKDLTAERKANAIRMLAAVNALLEHLKRNGVVFKQNPRTETLVSGQTQGGFREQGTSTGRMFSAHKEGLAVDVYDPQNAIDAFITKQPELLERFGLYREHPSATPGWCHLTIRPPKSGRRTFYP